jgi:hypothetical protein
MKKYMPLVLLLCCQTTMPMDEEQAQHLDVTVIRKGETHKLQYPHSFKNDTAATIASRAREHLNLKVDIVQTSQDDGETWIARNPESPVGNKPDEQVKVTIVSNSESFPERRWRGYWPFFAEIARLWTQGTMTLKNNDR